MKIIDIEVIDLGSFCHVYVIGKLVGICVRRAFYFVLL
jgi:hypothetical protein